MRGRGSLTLPLRVFGRPGTTTIISGVAIGPMCERTTVARGYERLRALRTAPRERRTRLEFANVIVALERAALGQNDVRKDRLALDLVRNAHHRRLGDICGA